MTDQDLNIGVQKLTKLLQDNDVSFANHYTISELEAKALISGTTKNAISIYPFINEKNELEIYLKGKVWDEVQENLPSNPGGGDPLGSVISKTPKPKS